MILAVIFCLYTGERTGLLTDGKMMTAIPMIVSIICPVLRVFQEKTDSSKMKTMSSSIGFKMSDKRISHKGKIADKI